MKPDVNKIIDLSNDVLVILDVEGKILHANTIFLGLLDQSHEEVVSTRFLDFISKNDHKDFVGFMSNGAKETNGVIQGRILNKHNQYTSLVWNAVYDTANDCIYLKGDPDNTLAINQDRDRFADSFSRLNEQLENQEQDFESSLSDIQRAMTEGIDKFRLISQNVSDLVCLHDPKDAKYVYVSPSLEELTGFKPEEFVGKSPYEFFHPDDLWKLAPDHRNKQKGEDAQGKLTFRMKHKVHGYRWAESFSRPIFDSEGNVLFILSNTRSIHERKIAEDERQTFFNYYKILANKIPNGAVFLLNQNSEYLIAEGEELKRLGRGQENYVGRHSSEVFDDRGKREVQPYFDLVLKGERVNFEFQNFGEYYQVLGEPFVSAEGEVLNAIILVQNITERRLFEEKLKQIVYELNFQKSALDISAYVSISDRDGNITYVNDRLCQISGYKHDELVGQSHGLFNSHYHPNSYWDEMYATLAKGEVWHGEMKNRDKNGDSFWADTYIVPFKNSKGEITQYVSIRFDVTQRKLMEEDLKAKNFELDSFVYHTSHDLRAPLTSILGLVNIILIEEEKENMKDYTRMIQSSILKLDDFIKSILTYSQNSNSERKYIFVNFHEIIDANLTELRYLKNFDKVDITIQLENEVPFYCDPIRLNIIFKNIISNSIKYAHHDRDYNFLKIKVKQTEEFAQIMFEDNGQGIGEDYQGRIFDMFYRANEASDGSGLGLYIVKQTMDRLGGIIRFNSVYNKGTTFTLEIPNKPADVEPDYE
ncbi:MAG: PAS domain S-box protein [Bacteroidota bacterium]